MNGVYAGPGALSVTAMAFGKLAVQAVPKGAECYLKAALPNKVNSLHPILQLL